MASDPRIALGRLPDRYGPHPTFHTDTPACTRLHTLFAEKLYSHQQEKKRQQLYATVCIQLCEGTGLESTSLLRRKNSLPYQATGSRAGAVRCPLPS